MTARTVFLDLESTGRIPGAHEAWEIAMIVRTGDMEREHVIFVEPEHLERAEPEALRINRFYERTTDLRRTAHPVAPSTGGPSEVPRPGPRPAPAGPSWTDRKRAAELIARETAGATLVGVNVQFDERFLIHLVRSGGYAAAWDYHLIDVRSLAIGYLEGKGRALDFDPIPKSYALSSLCGVGAPHADKAHTALADARWARDWHDAIRGGAR